MFVKLPNVYVTLADGMILPSNAAIYVLTSPSILIASTSAWNASALPLTVITPEAPSVTERVPKFSTEVDASVAKIDSTLKNTAVPVIASVNNT